MVIQINDEIVREMKVQPWKLEGVSRHPRGFVAEEVL